MRKFLIMFFVGYLFISGNVFAEEECEGGDDCFNTFKITLYNNNSHNCSLINQSIIYGRLHSRTRIPNYLAPGSLNEFQMVEEGKHGASILLTYQCDEDHEITFLSHSNLRPTGLNPMKGTVENTKNMRAIMTDQAYDFWNGRSTMDWSLETSH
ncbi:MAG: hypothetical protein KBB94_08175 [Legionellaceae bacterium]|nr:hypothetical protein [Legionellaceae bacterium]MBP9775606.1 hypothetical protein [Legionellaceae bacterium]